MKKLLFLNLMLFFIFLAGCCSIPRAQNYPQLYSITKEEKKNKGGFGMRRKAIVIKDFRDNEKFDKDITGLKEEVEKYIAIHPDIGEARKNNLRELKVTAGITEGDVKLLLGEPDKITPGKWVYKINKPSNFTIIFLPVFFSRESYHLHFKDKFLTAIERHYLEQTFQTSDSNAGLFSTQK